MMNLNNSQIPRSPTGSSSQNNENESNINQLLFAETITTSQSPSISFNMTNMIPSQIPMITNTSEHNNLSRRREGRRRRRQRNRQRRRERREALRQQQIHQQRQRQQQVQQQRRQRNTQQRHYPSRSSQRQQERYQRWQERSLQWEREENRQPQRRQRPNYDDRILYPSDPMEEPMDEIYNEPLLEAYMWEKLDPEERWEQEQINELEGFAVLEHLEQLALIQDELEQLQQIDHIERLQEEEEQIQLEHWEQDKSTKLKDPSILAYISQLEDDIEQLRQIDALQTMDNEILEQQKQERNDQEIIQMEEWETLTLRSQQLNKN
ncbi:unnamed protein product [Adineta steineri]|uniref:Uncharacterized protein n=1 Tax=Adineta steineri TaxID=433720 RepID=A0A819L8N0_9BILA|nr:unnamed protein product [Adineta steineri]CAF1411760.1 unnamed protein product [Adineta steineri]CAF1448112.1 unnamed protein product [Adineta steineri]CAF3935272.1 unnamed protein product [Adineta steineri]CAF3956777.1 unnamed protein product [Adineta steineri]